MITPQQSVPDIANAFGIPKLYLKREDLHPYGSHKGRSIPYMIDGYEKKGKRNFVISSSGNAAIAAVKSIGAGSYLIIFVGKKIDPEKLKRLNSSIFGHHNIELKQVENPKQLAIQEAIKTNAVNLRQSTDDTALIGYKSLAEELMQIPNLQAVFVPTSSGATAQALGLYLPNSQIHIVQTEAVHPIAEYFDKNFTSRDYSEASAIVDKIAHRKNGVISAVKKSNGSGWVVSDKEIRAAIAIIKNKTGIDASPNGALSVAGLQKAIQSKKTFTGAVACIISGL